MKLAKFSAKFVAKFRRSLEGNFRASFAGENRQKHFPPKLHRKFHHQTSLRGSGLRRALQKSCIQRVWESWQTTQIMQVQEKKWSSHLLEGLVCQHACSPQFVRTPTPRAGSNVGTLWKFSRKILKTRRAPDYSSNLCPPKIWSIWLFRVCFGPASFLFFLYERPKNTPWKKSYRPYFRQAQIRWVIWCSSKNRLSLSPSPPWG